MSDARPPKTTTAGLSDFDPMDNTAFVDLVRESSDRLRRLKGKPGLTSKRTARMTQGAAEASAPRRFD